MHITAIIIGIDGWEKYTSPLIESIKKHEENCDLVVIDNASVTPYPKHEYIFRFDERLSYSKAINNAHKISPLSDWYIVLSNDVLCTGSFFNILHDDDVKEDNCIVGPCLKENQGWTYLEGWCVAIPSYIWNALNGWDENFLVSSWEDVDFSITALEKGYNLLHYEDFPFIHLDQKQRFTLIPNYWQSEDHNIKYFREKHSKVKK